ncbi:insecticidal delta-endotoxin Cry8Ea1 family protein [Bacillus sp. A17A.1]
METLKAIGSLGGNTLKQAYADSQVDGGNFNNTFRTLAMGSAALIPYGGVVISPLIGLLWPADTTAEKNQLKKMMDNIAAQTHEQIGDFYIKTLKPKSLALMERLKRLEDSINDPSNKGGFYNSGSVEETNRINAIGINNDFRKILADCQVDGFQQSGLPAYIIIATAHMNFLKFIEQHGKVSKLQFDTTSLKQEFLGHKDDWTKEYIDYVTSFAKKELDTTNQIEEIVQNLQDKFNKDKLLAAISKNTIPSIIKGESQKLEETLNYSINNIAFKQAANITSEFTLNQNGRPLYYSPDGNMQTGWKEISTSFATKHDKGSSTSEQLFSTEWLKVQGLYIHGITSALKKLTNLIKVRCIEILYKLFLMVKHISLI